MDVLNIYLRKKKLSTEKVALMIAWNVNLFINSGAITIFSEKV